MGSSEEELKTVVAENKTLKDMVYQLQETQRQLVQSEKMASIGKLSAGIAHEINNPVGFVSSNSTSLLGYIGRIKEVLKMYRSGIGKELIERREKQLKLEFILEDIDKLLMENIEGLARITSIVGNLKKFSHDSQTDEFIESDINDGLRSVLILVKNETKYYADIHTDFGEIGKLSCNISRLNQVFLNVIINAVQAIKEQQRTEKGLITIKTGKEGAWVFVDITDDGPGIPVEVRDKIFDPFFTTKPVGVGTGLGLSICYEIVVKGHGGEVRVDSDGVKGTTFSIRIPRTGNEHNG